jgi:uncharacterized membrane protein
LRVSVLCFWFIRRVSCIQYCVFLCCVFGLYVVCLVSSITCFCVVFLVYTLFVLYPVLRVSTILDTRQTTYKPKTQHRNTQYCIQDKQRINQKHNTETRNTGYKTNTLFVLYPVLRISVFCFWFIRCVSCIQYYVFLCCVFGLYVVFLVSSIVCFCVVFLVKTQHRNTQYCIQDKQRINQKHNTETRNTGYKTNNV